MSITATLRNLSSAGPQVQINAPVGTKALTVAFSGGSSVVAQAFDIGGSLLATSDPLTIPVNNPTLVPGSGWGTSSTATPSVVGSDSTAFGYTASVILKANVVADMDFTGTLRVGFCMRHVSEDNAVATLERLDVAVNGGAWTSCWYKALNPDSGCVEHFCTLNASDFPAGERIEVRAIGHPKEGQPTVLSGLYLWPNATHSSYHISPTGNDQTGDGSAGNPWQSMLGASVYGEVGSYVYMASGTYTQGERLVGFRDDGGRYQTFLPESGASVTYVVGSASMRAGRLHFGPGITMDFSAGTVLYGPAQFWGDGIIATCAPSLAKFNVSPFSADQAGSIYLTNSTMSKIGYGAGAVISGALLVRNCHLQSCPTHALNDCALAINNTADDIYTGPPTQNSITVTGYATGGTIAAGMYQVAVTSVLGVQESVVQSSVTVTLMGTASSFTVTSPTSGGMNPMSGYFTAYNVYVLNGTSPHLQNVSPIAVGTNYTQTTTPLTNTATVSIEEGHVDGISLAGGNEMYINNVMTRVNNSLAIISYYGVTNLVFDGNNIQTSGTGPGGQSQFDRQNSGDYLHVYINDLTSNQALVFDDRDGGRSTQWAEILVKNSRMDGYSCPNPIRMRGNVLTAGTPVANQN